MRSRENAKHPHPEKDRRMLNTICVHIYICCMNDIQGTARIPKRIMIVCFTFNWTKHKREVVCYQLIGAGMCGLC